MDGWMDGWKILIATLFMFTCEAVDFLLL